MLRRLLAIAALGLLLVAPARATTVGGIGAYTFNTYSITTTSTDVLLGGDVGVFRRCWQIYNVGANLAWCTIGTATAGSATATSTNGVPVPAGFGVFGICPGPTQGGASGPSFQSPAFDVACISSGAGTTLIALDF